MGDALNNGTARGPRRQQHRPLAGALGVEVDGLYHRLLNRNADMAGLAGW